jgi:hypothetical protein
MFVAGGDDMLDGEYTPLNVFRGHCNVRVYLGITGNGMSDRPRVYIANKHYGGSKEQMKEDGWQSFWLLRFIDPVFDDRRYTADWAERYLQSFIQSHDHVQCEWTTVEDVPLYREKKSNIPDTGMITLYICCKCE